MFSTSADAGALPRTTRPSYQGIAKGALAAAILLVATPVALAQTATEQLPAKEQSASELPSRWEFLVASGTLIPTGAQRDVIQRANITAAQLTYVVRPELAITAALGWARSRDIAVVGDPRLDIFTYDLGAEFRPAHA